jgi:predicted nuclease of predicted toxin-antitoxin system
VRFLVDAQLPPALARILADRGHEASHVVDVGLLSSADEAVWRYAIVPQSVLITKDEDFAALSRRLDEAPEVLWLRIGNTSRRALLGWFDERLPGIVDMLEADERLIEVRYVGTSSCSIWAASVLGDHAFAIGRGDTSSEDESARLGMELPATRERFALGRRDRDSGGQTGPSNGFLPQSRWTTHPLS